MMEGESDPSSPILKRNATLHPLWMGSSSPDSGVDGPEASQGVFSPTLHQAAQQGDVEKVRALLDEGKGAVNARDRYNRWTPLHEAAINNHLGVARLLLERGAKPNAVDLYNETPLHRAAWKGNEEIVALLLDHGSLPDARNEHKLTPLHFACHYGHLGTSERLLDHGARLQAVDVAANTPLHLAAWKGRTEVVGLLLERGADPTIKNQMDVTPIDYARMGQYQQIVDLFFEKERMKARVAPIEEDGEEEDGTAVLDPTPLPIFPLPPAIGNAGVSSRKKRRERRKAPPEVTVGLPSAVVPSPNARNLPPRIQVALEGMRDPLGAVEVEDKEVTLSELRRTLVDELDNLPDSFIFLRDNLRVTPQQECKYKAMDFFPLVFIRAMPAQTRASTPAADPCIVQLGTETAGFQIFVQRLESMEKRVEDLVSGLEALVRAFRASGPSSTTTPDPDLASGPPG